MNIPTVYGVLVLIGSIAVIAPTRVSQAQSSDKAVSAPKDAGGSAATGATPNTNMNPTKHHYWRHRGGRHPHYGGRRVRT